MTEALIKLVEEATRIFRRALVSALYLATATIVMILAPNYSRLLQPDMVAIVPVVVFLATPFAHGAYEVLMPFHRILSVRPLIYGFQRVTLGKCETGSVDYDFLREWRRKFFDNPSSEYLKAELEKNLAIRQQLTYLFSNCFSTLLVVSLFGIFGNDKRIAMWLGIAFSLTSALLTSLAHRNRSYALGRTYGHAYLSWLEAKKIHIDKLGSDAQPCDQLDLADKITQGQLP